ncbi:response regulator transcription factor [Thalassobius sp. S69A]|uniref:response regulator transcription factor n=1 Tax=Thalassobius sp. S69A TaxID=3450125 RepID=UPI000C10E898|nr:DNA-binding response regulator [Paracoccaceae bacterium]MBT26014.1 DNA-binding response regulator [Paracoccaceae bacterium]
MRILLVEDEPLIADAIRVSLTRAGYHVDWASDGDMADEALHGDGFHLVILDLGLPERDGLSVLGALRRRHSDVPVIILTAREATENRIEGLDLGADDYMTKPFDMDELLARCRVQLRRGAGRAAPVLTHGALELRPQEQAVFLDGARVELPLQAYRLLLLMLERRGHVCAKSDLTEALYGWDEGAESNTIEVYVSLLRRKLGKDLIRTIRGIGYVIDKPA